MSDAANRSEKPEQLPAITSLTSMFPIHISTPEQPADQSPAARSAQGPKLNTQRPPVRHRGDRD